MNKQLEWLQSVNGGKSVRRTAEDIGVQQVTLNRQITGLALSPENIVRICRYYDADILDGFVVIGLITAEEREKYHQPSAIKSFSNKALADEVYRRIVDYGDDLPPELKNPPAPDGNGGLKVLPDGSYDYQLTPVPDFGKMAACDPGYSPEEELNADYST